MSVSREQVSRALASVVEPDLGRPLVDLGMVQQVELRDSTVRVVLRLTNAAYPKKAEVAALLEKALRGLDGVEAVDVSWYVEAKGREIGADDPVPGARNIILVMSGKGGVGKSTVAANLALGLAETGAKVGLLDADMYGPSIPTMFGISGRPLSTGTKIEPLTRFGVKLMSIGFLLEDDKAAVVWRGPMLHGALLQFLKDVDWGDLDYLLLDLPPGTGDIALTLSQNVRATGAVIVTTPQEVALQDVYKSVSMARKVGITVLGVVENESYFVCDKCETRHELFGSGGGQKVADYAEAPLLGQIPLETAVRKWGDAGTPVVKAAPEAASARAFKALAERLVAEVGASAAPQTLTIDRSGGVNRRLPVTR